MENFFNLLKTYLLKSIFFLFGEIDFSVYSSFQIIIDIFLVSVCLYFLFRFIKRIHATYVLLVFVFLLGFLYLAKIYHFLLAYIFLQVLLVLLIVSIPLMFQQETRQFFEKIRNIPWYFFPSKKQKQKTVIIKILKKVSKILAEKRHGALIVLEKNYPLHIYSGTGIILNAKISKELLLNLFFPKSPLHDGAVIIKDDRVICAGAVLPFTHSHSEYMGTRHKSAIGLSEMTDAIVIVISEERGEIALARNGKLYLNIKDEYLEHYLNENL
jgi:diadenylate cyclase